MLLYLIYVPLMVICMIICYLTNWLVVLFCNDVGEITTPFLKYFQTWDNSCDSRQEVTQVVPKWLAYDFDSKYECYKGSDEALDAMGRTRTYVRLKPGVSFTTKERIQRYFCRALWLYRNCAYGFAFYWFGRITTGKYLKRIVNINKTDAAGHSRSLQIWIDPYRPFITRGFRVKCDLPINSKLRWDIYFGWKMDTSDSVASNSAIAMRWIAIKKVK